MFIIIDFQLSHTFYLYELKTHSNTALFLFYVSAILFFRSFQQVVTSTASWARGNFYKPNLLSGQQVKYVSNQPLFSKKKKSN